MRNIAGLQQNGEISQKDIEKAFNSAEGVKLKGKSVQIKKLGKERKRQCFHNFVESIKHDTLEKCEIEAKL